MKKKIISGMAVRSLLLMAVLIAVSGLFASCKMEPEETREVDPKYRGTWVGVPDNTPYITTYILDKNTVHISTNDSGGSIYAAWTTGNLLYTGNGDFEGTFISDTELRHEGDPSYILIKQP
jgi:hypothetical protein